jgi:hypothetical protein
MKDGDLVRVRDLAYARKEGIANKLVSLAGNDNHPDFEGFTVTHYDGQMGVPRYLYIEELEPLSPLEQLANAAE